MISVNKNNGRTDGARRKGVTDLTPLLSAMKAHKPDFVLGGGFVIKSLKCLRRSERVTFLKPKT